MVLLVILKNILLASLGEKVVAKALFGLAKWLAKRSDTVIDDDIVKAWEETYYDNK